ncbi:MAG TPA: UPF0182 family protein [Gemmatimonadaceae bacterium]|nr:UPF0182 family protein [Gemmatimonadaceae bacterium]
MRRRRLLLGVVAAAAILVAGRAISALYADYSWYGAMGASAVWSERALDLSLIHGAGFGLAFAIAFANFSALAGSIGSLTLPRRLANVEFGEAVPRRYVDRFAFALSLGVAAALMPLLPAWTSLALARRQVRFGDVDPYFQHDLAFYTTWLPFEKSVYSWFILLVVVVSLVVVALYSLTPGLSWERSGLRMSTRVRRHLSVLAAVILLVTVWSYRLASYDLLIQSAADAGSFSYVEHRWLLPGLLILSIVTVAAAATVLFSGWTGQLRTGFVAVTAVIILAIGVQEIAPLLVRRLTPPETLAARNRAYAETRAEFTRRAYDFTPIPRDSNSSVGDTADLSGEGLRSFQRDSLVYPGARGLVSVADAQVDVAGQRLGDGFGRLAYAWAYQAASLLSDSVPGRARLVTVRDVRTRVAALAPVFAQGSAVQPLFHADTLYWKINLYSASSDHPLSDPRVLAGAERSYFRHAGTALVNGRTARVIIAPAASPDPIAREWMRAFPNAADYRATAILRRLTTSPWNPAEGSAPASGDDAAFRGEVTRLYNLMRASLAAGNLGAFSAAYDSLGALIGPRR